MKLIVAIYSIFSEYFVYKKINDEKESITYKIEDNDCNKSKNEIEMTLIIDIQPKLLIICVQETSYLQINS